MGAESLKAIRLEAEISIPAVRAAAFMRIARVLTASDREAARELFVRALEEARSVNGHEGEALLEDARMYAAAVAPELVSAIPHPRLPPPRERFNSDKMGRIMMEHGHVSAALEFVLRCEYGPSFPFGLAHQLIGKADGEYQIAILRRAIEAWRSDHEDEFLHWGGFLRLFRLKWSLLPMDEARSVTREIVRVVLDAPDRASTARYGDEPKIEITSVREHALFEILNVLRAIEPELAESLIAEYAQLAIAARRWPKGTDSIREEAEARRKKMESEGRKGGGFAMGWAGNDPNTPLYLTALRQAQEDGEFVAAFGFATGKYEEDTAPENPNLALKASWPSSCMFCTVLYKAGKCLGDAAGSYLSRIPDPDQRLLARIELAAALAGLPEFQQTQRGYSPKGNRRRDMPRE